MSRIFELILGYLSFCFSGILLIGCLWLVIAFWTVYERKLLATAQRRRGPDIAGLFGWIQAYSDGLKALTKEIHVPIKSIFSIYVIVPLISFFFIVSALFWFPIGGIFTSFDFSVSGLIIWCFLSLWVVLNMLAGLTSGSKYSRVGGIRIISIMVSYEMCYWIGFWSVCILSGGFSIGEIVDSQNKCWFLFPLMPLFIVLWIMGLAECGRSPFDLVEGESEIVSGYHVEYSSITFVFFFLAEYGNLFWMSVMSTCFFLGGGYCIPFIDFTDSVFCLGIKVSLLLFFLWLARAVLPRIRIDEFMRLCWKRLFPICWSEFLVSILLIRSIPQNNEFNWDRLENDTANNKLEVGFKKVCTFVKENEDWLPVNDWLTIYFAKFIILDQVIHSDFLYREINMIDFKINSFVLGEPLFGFIL